MLVFRCSDEECSYKACLADFGISKVWDNGPDLRTRGLNYTRIYAGPELTDEGAHEVYGKYPTMSSDVYAYGCVIIEVRPMKVLLAIMLIHSIRS